MAEMTAKRYKNGRGGMTFVEVMIAMLVLSFAVLGAAAYRYHAAADARRADVYVTGARLASLLLEDWKAHWEDSGLTTPDYDPVVKFGSEIVISSSGSGPASPSGFTSYANGSGTVVADGVTYYVTLSYLDTVAQPRTLNVRVAWRPDYSADGIDTDANPPVDPFVELSAFMDDS